MADGTVSADRGAGMDDDADKGLMLNMDARLERALRLLSIAEQDGKPTLEQATREALGAMTAVADGLALLDEPRTRLHVAINWLDSALEREVRSDPGRKAAAD